MNENNQNTTEVKKDSFDLDKALNNKKFLDFLAKRQDAENLVTSNAEAEIEKVQKAFEMKERISKELVGVYKTVISAEHSGQLSLTDKDFEAVDGELERVALESPEKLAEMEAHIERYKNFPQEIKKVEEGVTELLPGLAPEDYAHYIKSLGEITAAYAGDKDELIKIERDLAPYVEAWETLQGEKVANKEQLNTGVQTAGKNIFRASGVLLRYGTKAFIKNIQEKSLHKEAQKEGLLNVPMKGRADFQSCVLDTHRGITEVLTAFENKDALTNLENKMSGLVAEQKKTIGALFGDYISKEVITAAALKALNRKDAEFSKKKDLAGLKQAGELLAQSREASTEGASGLEYVSAERNEQVNEDLNKDIEKAVQGIVENATKGIKTKENNQLATAEKAIDTILTHGEIGGKSVEDIEVMITTALLDIKDTLKDDQVATKLIISRLIRKYGQSK